MSSTCSVVLLSNFLRSLASCLVTGVFAAAEPVPVLELDWEAVPSLVSTLLTGGVVVSFLEDLVSLEGAILVAQGYRSNRNELRVSDLLKYSVLTNYDFILQRGRNSFIFLTTFFTPAPRWYKDVIPGT